MSVPCQDWDSWFESDGRDGSPALVHSNAAVFDLTAEDDDEDAEDGVETFIYSEPPSPKHSEASMATTFFDMAAGDEDAETETGWSPRLSAEVLPRARPGVSDQFILVSKLMHEEPILQDLMTQSCEREAPEAQHLPTLLKFKGTVPVRHDEIKAWNSPKPARCGAAFFDLTADDRDADTERDTCGSEARWDSEYAENGRDTRIAVLPRRTSSQPATPVTSLALEKLSVQEAEDVRFLLRCQLEGVDVERTLALADARSRSLRDAPSQRDTHSGEDGLSMVTASAAGAVAGAAAIGTVGATSGALVGVSVGTLVGIVPAAFTFGLSIPVSAAVMGCTGLITGGAVGSTAGAVGGGLVGLLGRASPSQVPRYR